MMKYANENRTRDECAGHVSCIEMEVVNMEMQMEI